jgi:hypothetical protein
MTAPWFEEKLRKLWSLRLIIVRRWLFDNSIFDDPMSCRRAPVSAGGNGNPFRAVRMVRHLPGRSPGKINRGGILLPIGVERPRYTLTLRAVTFSRDAFHVMPVAERSIGSNVVGSLKEPWVYQPDARPAKVAAQFIVTAHRAVTDPARRTQCRVPTAGVDTLHTGDSNFINSARS